MKKCENKKSLFFESKKSIELVKFAKRLTLSFSCVLKIIQKRNEHSVTMQNETEEHGMCWWTNRTSDKRWDMVKECSGKQYDKKERLQEKKKEK